mmetsp:Transcript_70233/g.181005  ORF Transcript_70233/g.181005 Transcript_70233/m.181005 type:complete len:89 (-) Transcript_70233:255-521(-)
MASLSFQGNGPIIQPYEAPSARRGELPGDFEPNTPTERFFHNMKKSPVPITWGGVAGAIGGTMIAGPYGGAIGVAAGLYLEKKMKEDK